MIISFIGLQTQEVDIKPVVNVVLKSDSEALDEVVVVAYGTQKASSLTASVSSVRADAIKDVPGSSFDQMLQGRASGLSVTTPSAGVGQAPIVHIRGVNSITSGTSPLYVVDGVPIEADDFGMGIGNANALSDINPADILSMDVLKDAAAAALYGSRAANGVVLITTRQGREGKAKVTYDAYVGFSHRTKFIDMMNAQEYVDFKNMSVRNAYGTDNLQDLVAMGVVPASNANYTYGNKMFNMMTDANGNLVDSKWDDTVFQNGFTQGHTVAVNGGTERVNYYVSANYNTQKGIVKGDEYKRLGGKANVSVKATDWLKIGVNANISSSSTSQVDAA